MSTLLSLYLIEVSMLISRANLPFHFLGHSKDQYILMRTRLTLMNLVSKVFTWCFTFIINLTVVIMHNMIFFCTINCRGNLWRYNSLDSTTGIITIYNRKLLQNVQYFRLEWSIFWRITALIFLTEILPNHLWTRSLRFHFI